MSIAVLTNNQELRQERHVYESCNGFENVSFIVGNVMTLEKFDIFFVKRLAAVMIFLVVDVIYYGTEMGMGN